MEQTNENNIAYNLLLLFLIQSLSIRGERTCSDDSDDMHIPILTKLEIEH